MSPELGAVAVFAEHRERLLGLAYRLLGTVADAEDVVQEAYLRLERHGLEGIERPGAWLSTVTARLCLDQLRSARARREIYVGPWLPEPWVAEPGAGESVLLAESVSMAFLVVLESLSPAERVAFVLRDVFAYEYGEIAAVLGRSEAACRQLVSRARRGVRERRPRFEADHGVRERLAEAFLAACQGADLDGLLTVLDPGVVLRSDGGGVVAAARRPIAGADRVARFLVGAVRKLGHADAEPRIAPVNGAPGVVLERDGRPIAVCALDVAVGRITGVNIVVNPDKLRRIAV